MTLATTMPLPSTHATTASSPAPPPIRAVGLSRTIEDRPILRNVDLSISSGRFVALLGANGAGKSTLLKILATLNPPTSGTLELFGLPIRTATAAVRARIGLIGHQSMLYHDLSALENLEFFGQLYGLAHPRARAAELLTRLGLAHRAKDPVKAFSRGMAQRVAIARALMHDPQLLLADEPFAGLDAPSTDMLERVLAELHNSGKTILLANHDIRQSLRLAQHAVVLAHGRKVIDAPASSLTPEAILQEMGAPAGGQPT